MKILLLSLLLTANAAFAMGGDVDNGGDTITCQKNNSNNFEGDYFIDYLVQYNSNQQPVPVKSLDESLDRIEKTLIKVPWMLSSFKEFRNDFLIERNYSRENIWESADFGLVDLNAAGALHSLPPENCHTFNQAVIRVAPDASGLPANKRVFRYVPALLDRLRQNGPLQMSFLLVHEWLWRFNVSADQNSRINYLLHTSSFEALSANEAQALIAGLGVQAPKDLDPWSPDSCVHDADFLVKLLAGLNGKDITSTDLGFGSPQLLHRVGSATHPEDREDRSQNFRTSFNDKVFFYYQGNINYFTLESDDTKGFDGRMEHVSTMIAKNGIILPEEILRLKPAEPHLYDSISIAIGPSCTRIYGTRKIKSQFYETLPGVRVGDVEEFVIYFSK